MVSQSVILNINPSSTDPSPGELQVNIHLHNYDQQQILEVSQFEGAREQSYKTIDEN